MIKRKLIIVVAAASLVVAAASLVVGCKGNQQYSDEQLGSNGYSTIPTRFGVIEAHESSVECNWYIVYDKKTGVEYLMTQTYRREALTPLYNSDGTVIVYPEVQ